MKFIRFGVTLTLIRERDIELVRQWRNDPVVVRNYAFRTYITPEMQQEWFKSVNNHHNLYAIINYQGEKVGVINMKNIDWEKMTYEGGIFIPYEKYHNTPLPAIISCFTTEIPFTWFDWNVGYAHVLKTNTATQSFVRQLGYELVPGQEEAENQEYRITRDSFNKRAARCRKALQAVSGSDCPGQLVIEPDEFENPTILFIEGIAKKSRALVRVETTAEGRVYTFS